MKLGLFLPNWVGDAVMATPALRGLRAEYPRAEIVGIARPVIGEVLAGADLLDRCLFYNPYGNVAEHQGRLFLRTLQAERLDGAILFTNSLRTAWLAWRSGARERIGFARDWRGWLLTKRITPKSKRTPHPVLDEYLRIGAAAGCRRLDRTLALAVSAEDHAALERFWTRQSPAVRQRPVICFNTGGAFGPAKQWPQSAFAELARRIVDDSHYAVLVLCGPSERDDARAIAAAANHPRVLSLADEPLSIGLTKAAIQQAELLVTTDSGPRHIATAFDVPVITLFGPTHIAWSETFFAKSIHLQRAVPCGPCQQRVCPLKHHRCMTELTVDHVYSAVRDAWRRFGTPDGSRRCA